MECSSFEIGFSYPCSRLQRGRPPSFPFKAFFFSGRKHSTTSDFLLYALSYCHSVNELLCRTTHHMLVVWCLEHVGKYSNHFFVQEWGMHLCSQISPPLGIFSDALFILFLQTRQASSIGSNIHVILVLLDKSIHQVFLSADLCVIQSHVLAQGCPI